MAIDKKLIEVSEFSGPGYKPLIDFKGWRVAVLNYLDEIQPWEIKTFERHNETDEIFVLIRGNGILFIGEGESKVERISSQVMETGKIYNIKQSVWHSVVLSREGSVLIVENPDTSDKNTDYSALLPQHCQEIIDVAKRELPEDWGLAATV